MYYIISKGKMGNEMENRRSSHIMRQVRFDTRALALHRHIPVLSISKIRDNRGNRGDWKGTAAGAAPLSLITFATSLTTKN